MTPSNPYSYLDSAGLTDVGRRRVNNEDAILCLPEAGVFCVADGIGGGAGGEFASNAVVENLSHVYAGGKVDELTRANIYDRSQKLVNVITETSGWIYEHAAAAGLPGAGTTAVAIIFGGLSESRAMILHVGDSRAYLFRDNTLELMTTDHSLATAAGYRDEKDMPARFHGIITRALGIAPHVQVELTPVATQHDDLFMICSDGLNRMLTDSLLQKMFRKLAGEELPAIVASLTEAANSAGGDDNISIILIRVKDVAGTPLR